MSVAAVYSVTPGRIEKKSACHLCVVNGAIGLVKAEGAYRTEGRGLKGRLKPFDQTVEKKN